MLETVDVRKAPHSNSIDSNLALLLEHASGAFGERAALSLGHEVRYDYRSLALEAARLGAGLQALGLDEGDRVLLAVGNALEFYPLLFAIWRAGLVAVPVNTNAPVEEIARIAEHSRSRLRFVAPQVAKPLAAQLAQLEVTQQSIVLGSSDYKALLDHDPGRIVERREGPNALAWLLYTSGTSGPAKGVMLSHRNVLTSCYRYLEEVEDIVSTDTMLHVTPLSHAGGLLGLPHIVRGANQVIPLRGDFDEVLQLLAVWPSCRMCLVPPLVRMLAGRLLAAPALLDRVKSIVYGSTPMYRSHLMQLSQLFAGKLIQLYGLSEIPGGIACLDPAQHARCAVSRDARPAPVGRVRRSVVVNIVDNDGQSLPAGQPGFVVCSGPGVAAGYFRDPARTKLAFREGGLWTGDIGVLDGDGFLTLLGRQSDGPLRPGSSNYAIEIEDQLLKHPEVRDCAVVSTGDEVVACVCCAPRSEVRSDELLAFYREARAGGPELDAVWFVGELPRNASGKVLTRVLRERAAQRTAPWSFWQRYESPAWTPRQFRLARTVEDAEVMRQLVREAWRLRADEKYFYTLYEEPEQVYEQVLAPLGAGSDPRGLAALCLIFEVERAVVGTLSLIFDHPKRQVEIGRAALKLSLQGQGHVRYAITQVRRFLEIAPDYAIYADIAATQPGAAVFMLGLGAQAVAITPSSFVFQPGSADDWMALLGALQSPEAASTLVYRSPVTGLGRFATALHLKLPSGQSTFRPELTAKQAPLQAFTSKTLDVATGREPQPVKLDEQEVQDLAYTATRTIRSPDPALDIAQAERDAERAGMETLCIEVPCDHEHRALAERLDQSGAWLCGVHADRDGYWYAAYALLLGAAHRARVLEDLQRVSAERRLNLYQPLLELLVEQNRA
jgi:long-chain acyl-CoA synthetase